MNADENRESLDSDLSLSQVQARTYLAASYSAEVDADRFYTKAAQFVSDQKTKDILEQLAGDEKKHQEQLAKAYALRFGESAPYQKTELPLPERANPGISPLEALNIALEAEEKAQSYYKEAEDAVTDSELKTLFAMLASFEQTHAARIREGIKELGE